MAGHARKTLAIDVGIAAPHAAHAGMNATETMRETKLDKCECYTGELHQATFTAYSRCRPCATNMLKTAAKTVAGATG